MPDTDNAFFNISRGDLTDPFLQVSIGSASPIKTNVVLNSLNPEWNENFSVPLCHYAEIVKVKVGSLIYKLLFIILDPFSQVKDREHVGNETVGWVDIPVEELLKGEEIRGPNGSDTGGWYDVVVKEKGTKKKAQGRVCFFITFTPL